MIVVLAIVGYLVLGIVFAYLMAVYSRVHDGDPLNVNDEDDVQSVYLMVLAYPIVLILMGIQGLAESIITLANKGKKP